MVIVPAALQMQLNPIISSGLALHFEMTLRNMNWNKPTAAAAGTKVKSSFSIPWTADVLEK